MTTFLVNRRARYVSCYDDEGNIDSLPLDVEQYISDGRFQHGDVISFDDYRDEETFIVYKNDEGRLIWSRNSDPYMAGYLHIPEEITRTFQDATSHYRDVIKAVPSMTLRLNSRDTLLVDLWGKIPCSVQFEVWCEDGQLTDLHLKQRGEWFTLGSVEKLTRDSIKKYLSNNDMSNIIIMSNNDMSNNDMSNGMGGSINSQMTG